MQKTKLLVAVLGTLIALPALADGAAPSPVTANISLTSNYLYRGISQTGANPAIQGGFDYAHSSGFYAGVWGSSISWLGDAGVASNAGLELDTYAGFKGGSSVTYDVGFLRYNYPGTYVAGATKADTNEIYGAIGYSIVTAKLSYSLGDLFGVSKAKGSTYIDLSASYPIADTGFTVGAHYGKQTYKGATADALKLAGADPTYADYNVKVSKDLSGYTVALMYSKTNVVHATTGGFYNVLGKDLGKGTVVLSLSRSL